MWWCCFLGCLCLFVWGVLCCGGVSVSGFFKVRGSSNVHSIQSAGAHTLGEVLCSFSNV